VIRKKNLLRLFCTYKEYVQLSVNFKINWKGTIYIDAGRDIGVFRIGTKNALSSSGLSLDENLRFCRSRPKEPQIVRPLDERRLTI